MRVLMGTGHRELPDPGAVRRHAKDLIELVRPDAVRSGGAPGFDVVLAEAALDLGVPLLVDLPNRYYRDVYGNGIGDVLLAQAAEVRFVVERPACANWRFRWGAERWWLDNHTRNHAMVDDSTDVVAGAGWHPLEATERSSQGRPGAPLGRKGGTAECLRYVVRHSAMAGVWWLPVADPGPASWVPIARQVDLFEALP